MSTVTQRVEIVRQPRGGYLNPKKFNVEYFEDGKTLNEENIHPTYIGMVVDYMSRYLYFHDVRTAFDISIRGYNNRIKLLGDKAKSKDIIDGTDCESLLLMIDGNNEKSIVAACKLCTYDVWYRNILRAHSSLNAIEMNPDKNTIENISIMLDRSLKFNEIYGPVIDSGVTFEPSGYTSVVDSGDGDFITNDTLWDFKVSKNKMTNKQTLQLLMYWVMSKHSKKQEYEGINKIGIFNPRLNCVYTLDMAKVSKEIVSEIENNVICYGNTFLFSKDKIDLYFEINEKGGTSIKEISPDFLFGYLRTIIREDKQFDYYYVSFLSEGFMDWANACTLKAKSLGDIYNMLDEHNQYIYPNELFEPGISIQVFEKEFIKKGGKEYTFVKKYFDKNTMELGKELHVNVIFYNKKIKRIVKGIDVSEVLSIKDGGIVQEKEERTLGNINEKNIYHCNDAAELILVPGKYEYLGRNSFPKHGIREVVIENGLKEIMEYAFSEMDIKKITIPKSVNKIGEYAFYKCEELEKVSIEANIDKLFQAVFNSCSMLQEIYIPDSIVSIGRNAFKNCIKLNKIRFSKRLKRIEYGAFSGCISIVEMSLPQSCEKIEAYAFEKCLNLKKIYVSKDCVIDELAFIGMDFEPEIIVQ